MAILDNIDTNTEVNDYLSLIPESLRDPQALAKKAVHADAHIKTLEARIDEMRNDWAKDREAASTAAKLQDLIDKLERPTQQLASSEQPPANEVRQPTLDMNELDKRFEARIQQHEAAKKAQENEAIVRTKLKERFGDNFSPYVKQQLDELGWTSDDFEANARKSPMAVLRALGADQKRSDGSTVPPRGQVSFSAGRAEPVKSWSYWQALKKENPDLYKSTKVTNEMTEWAVKLGYKFYDGDYNRFGDSPVIS